MDDFIRWVSHDTMLLKLRQEEQSLLCALQDLSGTLLLLFSVCVCLGGYVTDVHLALGKILSGQ